MSGPFFSQFPQHRISNTDNLRHGNATSAGRQKLGIPLGGQEAQAAIRVSLGAPAAAAANNVAVSQAVALGGLFLLNGTLGGVTQNGVVGAMLDFPRTLVAAWTTAAILTIVGQDEYGATMTEVTASGTSHAGKKAFKFISSITSSASITGATVGTGAILGLPYVPSVGGFIRVVVNENTADAATYTVPERVLSTTSTNDVRGTVTPVAALNGTNVFTAVICVKNGPNDYDGYGISQA